PLDQVHVPLRLSRRCNAPPLSLLERVAAAARIFHQLGLRLQQGRVPAAGEPLLWQSRQPRPVRVITFGSPSYEDVATARVLAGDNSLSLSSALAGVLQ